LSVNYFKCELHNSGTTSERRHRHRFASSVSRHNHKNGILLNLLRHVRLASLTIFADLIVCIITGLVDQLSWKNWSIGRRFVDR